jgi:Tol biopolymer transport system component
VRFDPRSNEPVAFSMDPDGTDMTQMFFSGFFSGHSEWPHWSPDGTQVTIFCCDDRRSPQIVDLDTGRLRERSRGRGPTSPSTAASPGHRTDGCSDVRPSGRSIPA